MENIANILKKELLSEADKKKKKEPKKAVGVLIIDTSTNTCLLMRRSKGDAIGQYSIPGGGVENAEGLEEALKREVKEEIGWEMPTEDLKRSFINKESEGLVYNNYILKLPTKINVNLNNEHDWYDYYPFDELPEPLHDGVTLLLKHEGYYL